MSRLLCVFCFLALLPFAANATSISLASIVNTNCSGTLTSSLLNGASFSCAGNLILNGGSITSDSVINISADGDLFLDNLYLAAPSVNFSNSSGVLIVGNGVVINTTVLVNQNIPKPILQLSDFKLSQDEIVSFNLGATGSAGLISVGSNETNSVALGVGANFGKLFLTNANGVVYPIAHNPQIVGGALVLGTVGGNNLVATQGDMMLSASPLLLVSSIPEPKTYALMLLGIGLISLRQRV
ncbi:PEP-CTERM sorting domain-containing protein [Methylotenera sp.]|uniref:PEP-CTERM sorting domain-containing protein n=1 Tax=Methylotenera sp. TaxID=2051956 RepID=UPI002488BD52|nr:PEP-CTERM sorting domain-containing protein [Methylotenera sp.]MDI1299379.1 PEP-CTERM sorting domain-containing protein [Methylotenera sp.]